MTKIKICGLYRTCDVDYVNEARPDFCGFILGVPKSHRNVTPDEAKALRRRLNPGIIPVGVFVNATFWQIERMVADNVISVIQLHGDENEAYIKALKKRTDIPVIKAFRIATLKDIEKAQASPADMILLDSGAGGTGETFNWSLIKSVKRPFILAGGLQPGNLETAVKRIHPWAVDMSSGIETDKKKDRDKIMAAVAAVRRERL